MKNISKITDKIKIEQQKIKELENKKSINSVTNYKNKKELEKSKANIKSLQTDIKEIKDNRKILIVFAALFVVFAFVILIGTLTEDKSSDTIIKEPDTTDTSQTPTDNVEEEILDVITNELPYNKAFYIKEKDGLRSKVEVYYLFNETDQSVLEYVHRIGTYSSKRTYKGTYEGDLSNSAIIKINENIIDAIFKDGLMIVGEKTYEEVNITSALKNTVLDSMDD